MFDLFMFNHDSELETNTISISTQSRKIWYCLTTAYDEQKSYE